MRIPQADYTAVSQVLTLQQREVLREIAKARGYPSNLIWNDPFVCTAAVALAVELLLAQHLRTGTSYRRALHRVAAALDLDYDTLSRQQRRMRRRQNADSVSGHHVLP